MTYEEEISGFVSDWDVAEWEETKKELLFFVCSQCGLISNRIRNHGECALQDYWHLNVKCFKKID